VKAVVYRHSLPIADPQSLIDAELPAPEPGARDLLVDVRAVSVNPVDVKVRARSDPAGRDTILGWDAAGVVRATGAQVEDFAVGDRVWYAGSIDRPGTDAELHVVDERIVGRMPSSLDFAHAAAMPLTTLTAWEMLFDRFRVDYGKRGPLGVLLIVGGAGGVGSMAIQLARRLTNLTIVATASRPETQEWVRSLGAHHVVDHTKPLVEQVRALAPDGADYIMSLTHTEQHFDELVDLLAPESHLGLIDDPASVLDFRRLKPKSAALHWEFMFTRSQSATKTLSEQGRILNEVADLVDAGVLRSTFTQDFGPLNATNLKRAHALVESNRSIGKVVLSV
jgi:zinc-binding alcohol dehydrogenase family protein